MSDKDSDKEVTLRAAVETDVGIVRTHNEDSAFADPNNEFFVVADGMGGHAAGEVASAMAVETIREALGNAREHLDAHAESPTDSSRQKIAEILEEAVRDAHRAVFERGVAEPEKKGMGTTLEVFLICGQEGFIAHVGDSRTYLVRGEEAAQITTDHTVAEGLVIQGKLSAEEAKVSPLRTILFNALGVAAELGVEMAHLPLHEGDRILLCSDGLHDYFPESSEIFTTLTTKEPKEALSELISAAKERGGHDNITGIVVEVVTAPEPIEISSAQMTAADGVPKEVSNEDTAPVGIGRGMAPSSDARATVPIRALKRDDTEDEREFAGEPTVEIPKEDLED